MQYLFPEKEYVQKTRSHLKVHLTKQDTIECFPDIVRRHDLEIDDRVVMYIEDQLRAYANMRRARLWTN